VLFIYYYRPLDGSARWSDSKSPSIKALAPLADQPLTASVQIRVQQFYRMVEWAPVTIVIVVTDRWHKHWNSLSLRVKQCNAQSHQVNYWYYQCYQSTSSLMTIDNHISHYWFTYWVWLMDFEWCITQRLTPVTYYSYF
jgi:hypothetical protein